MTTMKVGGRELALAFTLDALSQMQETFGRESANLTEKSMNELFGSTKNILTLLAILANQGEELAGRTPDITAKWLGQHMKPTRMPMIQAAMLDAIQKGMDMETAEDDPAEEVDVVLEELKKKDSGA